MPVDLVALAWMEAPGPWDVRSLAAWVGRQAAEHRTEAPVHLVGHSTGGVIALAAAVAHPELFTGVLVAGTGPNMLHHKDIGTLLASVRDAQDTSFADAVVARSYARQLPPDLHREVIRYARAGRREVVLEVLTSQHVLDLEPELAAVTLPVQVVHGRHDRARSLDDARRLLTGLPDAELVVLDTGHTPMAEDPEGFAAAVRRLLERCQ